MHKPAIISIPTETPAIKKIINLLLESEKKTLPFPEETWNLYFILKPRSAYNLCSLYEFVAVFQICFEILLFSLGRWFVVKSTAFWVIWSTLLYIFGHHSCHQWSIFFIMHIGMKLNWFKTSKLFSTYSTFNSTRATSSMLCLLRCCLSTDWDPMWEKLHRLQRNEHLDSICGKIMNRLNSVSVESLSVWQDFMWSVTSSMVWN